ncbi:MAG: creatininase family protein [Bacteroidota bacterium]
MKPRPYVLKETNWKSVKDIDYKVAILPWGATEAHGWHLPYATDNYEAAMVAELAAEKAWEQGAKVVVLPEIPFGVNTQQMDLKLTINMNPSTQLAVLQDVIESLEKQGIEKLVVLNGHGGNDFKWIIRELQKDSDVFISAVNWFAIKDEDGIFDDQGDHADEMETSFMLHAYPELVLPKEEWGDGESHKLKIDALNENWAWTPREWTKATVDTGVGSPKLGTAEKGEKFIEYVTNKIAKYFVDLADADVDDLYEK